MKRQTRTELNKIVMIGMARIDQVVNKLCDECVAPQITPEINPIHFGSIPDPGLTAYSLHSMRNQSELSKRQSQLLAMAASDNRWAWQHQITVGVG